MLPINLCSKCRFHASPYADQQGPLRREKQHGLPFAPKIGAAGLVPLQKGAQVPANSQESCRWSYQGSKNCYAA
jgi:hypothetical protein